MVDYISRQAALAWCKKDDWGTPDERWRPESEYGRYIESLPTAERKGHWINRNGDNIYPFWERYKCSVCGGNSNNSDYCPSCGARMEIEE